MPSLPFTSGASTTICRSKRPGRRSAGSSTSGLLVAARRITPSFVSKPSISTRSAFRVCSRSSCPPPSPAPRCLPTASISSTKIIQGACSLPCSKRSRTREAPTPTNISTKSEPDIWKKGRPASPATALARRVLPVPGGPTSRTPVGKRPPNRENLLGSLRNWIISSSSCFASSAPATSAKVTLGVSGEISLALDRPNWNARLPPPCIVRKIQIQKAINSSQGSALSSNWPQLGRDVSASMMTSSASRSPMSPSVISPGRVS